MKKDTPKIIVANWKMFKSHDQSIEWTKEYTKPLNTLLSRTGHSLIICPTATAINQLHNIIMPHDYDTTTSIALGAQTCSKYESGAHTGDISAQSLYESGACYCIIGHSERRQEQHESDTELVQKLHYTLKASLIPIFCIGESSSSHTTNITNILAKQLEPIWQTLKTSGLFGNKNICMFISYEPNWAIGTGKIPEIEKIQEIINWLNSHCSKYNPIPARLHFYFLYGGSINGENIKSFSSVNMLSGFLVGKASLDYDSLTKLITNLD